MSAATGDVAPRKQAPATDDARRRIICLELEFDGTDFEGWQRQATGRTVQGTVEQALARILGSAHSVVGCGRTDAGVHARGMIASFRTCHGMSTGELARALDAVLPPDVGVLAAEDAPAGFHARRDALWKWYRYRLLVSRGKRPLRRHGAWRVPAVPPVEALEAASIPLLGRHDFRSFGNLGSSPGSTVRRLHVLRWSARADLLRLDVVGDGFLYKMVRTLVGTLLEAARGPDPAGAVRRILDARDRRAAGPVAPPNGLCLMAVGLRGRPAPSRVPALLVPRVDSGSPSPRGGSS